MSEYSVKKQQQELNRLHLKQQREKTRKRKERTRRLIVKGALLEKYFKAEHLSTDETEKLLRGLQVIAKSKVKQMHERKKSD